VSEDLGPSEPRIINDAQVRQILDPHRCREVVRDALVALARGAAMNPVRTVIETEHGWFANMPAAVRGGHPALGAKLVTAFPANAELGLPTHRAVVVLMDPQTGALSALVDGDAITERRTAAVSVLAAECLATRAPGVLAILGAGVQGQAHLAAFADAQFVSRVVVWSRNPERARSLADTARGLGLEAECADTPDAAVRSADLVVTATASPEPLFTGASISAGTFVCAVGACVPNRRELPTELVAACDFYADDIAAVRCESGDLVIAERELARELPVAGTLGELLAGIRVAQRGLRPAVFESLGLGIEDVACAAFVVAALKGHRGFRWPA